MKTKSPIIRSLLAVATCIIGSGCASVDGHAGLTPLGGGDRWVRFSAPIVIAGARTESGSPSLPRSVAVANDGTGRWVLVTSLASRLDQGGHTDADLWVCRSDDNGTRWTRPTLLHAAFDADGGDDMTPSLATDGHGTWVVVWTAYVTGEAGEWRPVTMSSRSVDAGYTWSEPAPLDRGSPSSLNEDPCIASNGLGQWMCVWSRSWRPSGRSARSEVVAVTSQDGRDWYPQAVVHQAAMEGALCRRTRVALNRNGAAVVAWVEDAPVGPGAGVGYAMATSSPGDMNRWSRAVALGETTGEGLALASGAGDLVMAVWPAPRDWGSAEIVAARSTDGGIQWSPPVVMGPARAMVTGASEPSIATDLQGHWLVAWQVLNASDGPQDWDLAATASADDGKSWAPPYFANAGAANDPDNDRWPLAAVDPRGRWMMFWRADSGVYDDLVHAFNDVPPPWWKGVGLGVGYTMSF